MTGAHFTVGFESSVHRSAEVSGKAEILQAGPGRQRLRTVPTYYDGFDVAIARANDGQPITSKVGKRSSLLRPIPARHGTTARRNDGSRNDKSQKT